MKQFDVKLQIASSRFSCVMAMRGSKCITKVLPGEVPQRVVMELTKKAEKVER